MRGKANRKKHGQILKELKKKKEKEEEKLRERRLGEGGK